MRIDFYLLESNQPDALWLVACRLLEKAYLAKHRVFVFCNNQQEAEKLDELLWTFKKDSFIPHNLQGEGPEPPPPIQIGFSQESRGFNDILLNMSSRIPPFYSKFKRIMEIVPAEEAGKIVSREHYKSYRAQGHNIQTHPVVEYELTP
jgi:DNA polymerase-3 subunit chi